MRRLMRRLIRLSGLTRPCHARSCDGELRLIWPLGLTCTGRPRRSAEEQRLIWHLASTRPRRPRPSNGEPGLIWVFALTRPCRRSPCDREPRLIWLFRSTCLRRPRPFNENVRVIWLFWWPKLKTARVAARPHTATDLGPEQIPAALMSMCYCSAPLSADAPLLPVPVQDGLASPVLYQHAWRAGPAAHLGASALMLHAMCACDYVKLDPWAQGRHGAASFLGLVRPCRLPPLGRWWPWSCEHARR
jgi:hypothetical protein